MKQTLQIKNTLHMCGIVYDSYDELELMKLLEKFDNILLIKKRVHFIKFKLS